LAPEDRIIDAVVALDPLADLPRTGWLLRGVRPCETIAEHSFGVALVAMLLVDELRREGETVDGERVLRMALVHDAPEARTGDVPMPVKGGALESAIHDLELELARQVLTTEAFASYAEAEAAESLEARIVKAADKLQMMIKASVYEQKKRGALDEFWANPKNFRDMGIPLARRVYERLRVRSGRAAPAPP